MVEDCMLSIKQWMDTVQLKVNPSKTEFIYFGNKVQLRKCSTRKLNVNGDLVERTDVIQYLGAWLDCSLMYMTHIMKKCQAAMANFQRIKSIHNLLNNQ